MINEITGFDANGNNQSNKDARSPDPSVSQPAIDRLKKSALNIGPSLLETMEIQDKLRYEGCNPNNMVVVCAVCGSQDMKLHHDSSTMRLDVKFIDSVLRLDELRMKTYIPSRVTGYLNLTALAHYALVNDLSLRVAYHELYESELATDAKFTQLCEDAAAAAAKDNELPIILLIVPELVQFSSKQHEKGVYNNVGSMNVCHDCLFAIGNNKQPDYGMGGKFGCDFGYPKYIDGFRGLSVQ